MLSIVFLLSSAFIIQRQQKVYAFGYASSFSDSVMYYTPIQTLDSVTLDGNGVLPYREHYTYQLKNYLETERGEKNRVCMIFFGTNMKKLQREYQKAVGKYKQSPNVTLIELNTDEFKFTRPDYN